MSSPGGGRPKIRKLDLARMLREEPPPVPWVIEDLVARGMVTVLFGVPGEGKSLLSAALAAGVATGQDEAGMLCRKGKVVIIDAENGEGEIWRRARTIDLPGPPAIEIYELELFDLRHHMAQLEEILVAEKPDLLVLDSFRSMWRGDENDSGEVAAVLDPLRNLVRRHQVGTQLLHHAGKSGSYRGNSAILGSVDFMFELGRPEDDADTSRRFIKTWKCRPAAEPARRWLRLEVEHGRVFIDAAEPPDGAERPAAYVSEALRPRVLAALNGKALRRFEIAAAVGRKTKDRTVGRILKDLVSAGELELIDGPAWRRVAGGTAPIGGRHPATPPANPHSNGKNEGGNPVAAEGTLATLGDPAWDAAWTDEDSQAFLATAAQIFPGSYELPEVA